MAEAKKSVFETLNKINVNEHKEDKNGLTYLSWVWAWAEVKKRYPDATYTIKRFENNLPYVYDEQTGYMVFTEVTIEGMTHEMWLPVMDGANKAMKSHEYTITTRFGKDITVKAADMFDINKTIMRCLVKNLAIFGLGLYIFANEDLPEGETPEQIADRKLKDADVKIPTADEFTKATKNAAEEKPKMASAKQKKQILDECIAKGKDLNKALAYYKVKTIDDLTEEQAIVILGALEK